MNLRTYLVTMARESRGSRGRLLFFTACLSVGVAAVVGVGVLVGTLDEGIRRNARQLLAADLVVSARRELPAELDGLLDAEDGLERTDVRELATVSAAVGRDGETRSRLTELKVVDGRYPFYGELGLDPPGTLADHLAPDTVVVGPELLPALDVSVGDELLVGGEPFRIVATVVAEPDLLGFSLTLGARVFMSGDAFRRTALTGVGNRVRYKALLHLPGNPTGAALADLEQRLRDGLPDASYLRFETHDEAQPTLRRSLGRVEDYLGLVALLSLLLGGVGVAQIVRAWIAERTQGIAVLRCLGLRPREILALYVSNVVVLALVGSAVGAAIGSALPFALLAVAPDLVPPDLVGAVPLAPLLRGLGLGVGVALLFSLPPLVAVWRVPPARVLRADAAPLPAPRLVRWGAGLALLAGLLGSAWVQADDLERAAWFTGGLVVTAALLALGARGLMRASRAIPRDALHPYLKHGLAALSRPGAGTTAAVVALGLGALVVLAMILVEGRLQDELATALPEEAPSSFLVDIQPDQWDGVRAAMEARGATAVDSVPVVMARLAEVGGVPVQELMARGRGGGGAAGGPDATAAGATGGPPASGGDATGTTAVDGAHGGDASDGAGAVDAQPDDRTADDDTPPAAGDPDAGYGDDDDDDDAARDGGERRRGGRRSRWVLTREQRLTWRAELPEDNEIVDGALWSDPDRAEVSLEEGFAEDLGVGVGDALVFDVQGVLVDVVVTSIRSVEWGSFSINFFVIVEPGLLEAAPHFRIAAARLDREAENDLEQELVADYPNVTLLRVRDIIEKVAALLTRLAMGVRVLGAFTALAGVVILAGAVASTGLRRAQEVALLKTLGVTRRGVIALFATEYALSGLMAGLIGGLGAYALSWAFLDEVAQITPSLPWLDLPVATAATAVLAVLSGIAASARALRVRPVESLRR